MSGLVVEPAGGRTTFRPGEEISGTASWDLEEPAESVELRLFWRAEGKGGRHVSIAEAVPLEASSTQGRREFALRAPEGPYSFSGKLIRLLWAIELVAEPGERAGRVEITLSPTGREVILHGSPG